MASYKLCNYFGQSQYRKGHYILVTSEVHWVTVPDFDTVDYLCALATNEMDPAIKIKRL